MTATTRMTAQEADDCCAELWTVVVENERAGAGHRISWYLRKSMDLDEFMELGANVPTVIMAQHGPTKRPAHLLKRLVAVPKRMHSHSLRLYMNNIGRVTTSIDGVA